MLASYFGSPAGLMDYLKFMVWLEKRHPELIKPEHPEPDLVYEEYRDDVDEKIRTIADEGLISEEEAELLIEHGTTQEKEDIIAEANERFIGKEMEG